MSLTNTHNFIIQWPLRATSQFSSVSSADFPKTNALFHAKNKNKIVTRKRTNEALHVEAILKRRTLCFRLDNKTYSCGNIQYGRPQRCARFFKKSVQDF